MAESTHSRRPSLRTVSQNIPRVSLGGRLHENYRSSQGASGTPDESERLVQPLLASSLSPVKEENKRGSEEESQPERKRGGDEFFGVSDNVRRIDSEGSVFIAHPSPSSRSLFLSRSGGMGPNPGACHPAQIN
ncbi:hypothetical protein ABVT39_025337 [Epinephelus coioides]